MRQDDPSIMDDFSTVLPIVRAAALAAGQEIMDRYDGDHLEAQQEDFPVTDADQAAHEVIVQHLQQTGFPILSEEQLDDTSYQNAETVWIIDPLDGTKDFVHRTGEFSVMIALLKESYPVFGLVYQPSTQQWVWGGVGIGAHREVNGESISIHVDQTDRYEEMKMVVSRHHLKDAEVNLQKQLSIGTQTPMGSAGLKMATIAAGEAHVYINTSDKTGEWDTAAGLAIVEAAGGTVTDMDGARLTFCKQTPRNLRGFIVSNGTRQNEIIETLKTCL